MAVSKNVVLYEVQVNTKTGQVNINNLTKGFVDSRKALASLNKEVNDMNVKLGSTSSAAGIAGAATAELGRTISDMPYGITAVTNNVSQLGSMFSLLVADTGSVKGAFNEIIKTISGPAGFLIAFQVAVALVEVFAQKSREAKDAVNEFNIALESQILNVRRVIRAYEDENVTAERRLELLASFSGLDKKIVEAAKQKVITEKEVLQALEAQQIITQNKKSLSEEDKRIMEEISPLLEKRVKLEEEIEIAKGNVANTQALIKDEEVLSEIQLASYKAEQIKVKKGTFELAFLQFEINEKIKERNPLLEKTIKAQAEIERIVSKINDLQKGGNDEEAKRLQKLLEMIQSYGDALAEAQAKSDLQRLELQRKVALREAEQFENNQELIFSINEYYEQLKTNLIEKETEKRERIRLKAEQKERDDNRRAAETSVNALIESYAIERETQLIIDEDKLAYLREKEASITEALNNEILFRNLTFGEAQLKRAEMERDLAEVQKGISVEQIRNDKVVANSKAAMVSAIGGSLGALSQMFGKTTAAGKATAIAQIALDTAAGYTRGLAIAQEASKGTGPGAALAFPVFYAQQVAAILGAVASAKKVLSTSPELSAAGGRSSVSASTSSPPPPPDFNVVGASQLNQLAETISGQEQQPIRTYVVASDVSTAQELDRNILSEASIG